MLEVEVRGRCTLPEHTSHLPSALQPPFHTLNMSLYQNYKDRTNEYKIYVKIMSFVLNMIHFLEFIKARDPTPPYHYKEERQLPANFDYGLYQTICLSLFLIEIINFTPQTWAALWVLTLLVFGLMWACDGNYTILGSLWLVLGYIDFISIIFLRTQVLPRLFR